MVDVDLDRVIELAVTKGRNLEAAEACAREVADVERRLANLRAGRAEDDDGEETFPQGFIDEEEPEAEAEDAPEAAEAMAANVARKRARKGKARKTRAAPVKLTIREEALALARGGEVDSASLADTSGCSRSVARAILGGLVRRGELRRLKAGKYGVA